MGYPHSVQAGRISMKPEPIHYVCSDGAQSDTPPLHNPLLSLCYKVQSQDSAPYPGSNPHPRPDPDHGTNVTNDQYRVFEVRGWAFTISRIFAKFQRKTISGSIWMQDLFLMPRNISVHISNIWHFTQYRARTETPSATDHITAHHPHAKQV